MLALCERIFGFYNYWVRVGKGREANSSERLSLVANMRLVNESHYSSALGSCVARNYGMIISNSQDATDHWASGLAGIRNDTSRPLLNSIL